MRAGSEIFENNLIFQCLFCQVCAVLECQGDDSEPDMPPTTTTQSPNESAWCDLSGIFGRLSGNGYTLTIGSKLVRLGFLFRIPYTYYYFQNKYTKSSSLERKTYHKTWASPHALGRLGLSCYGACSGL